MNHCRYWHACAVVMVLGLANQARAQDITIAEPEYAGNIVFVDGDAGVALEKQRASNKVKSGFFKASGLNVVKKALSPVRIIAAGAHQFIVRSTTNEIDPVQLVNVFRLESVPKKKYRTIQTSSGSFSGSSSMEIDFITFTSRKYGSKSYLLTIDSLEPGEYAMTLDGSRDLFNMFGVD